MRISIERQRKFRRRLRQAATIGAAVTGSACLGTLGLSYYVAHMLTAPRRRKSPMDDFVMTPFETGADFEEISFPSLSGEYQLSGWWLTRPETDQVVIGCHGYRSSKSELIGIATIFWRAGFNVMLFDFHGHGAAAGSNVTLGYRESQDLCAAIDFAAERITTARIGIFGYSMGASVAIMASIQRKQVRCVLADSPFARHRDVVAHNVSRVTHLSGRPIALLADQFLPHLGGYRSKDVEPVRDVAQLAPRPLFVIHGTADATVPVEQAVQIYRMAQQPKELWLVEGAPHCGAYFQDRTLYSERTVNFFMRYLSERYLSERYLSEEESADASSIRPLRGKEPA